MSDKSFTQRVYDVVAAVPRGRVITYREIARRAGSPRAARAVGNIMNKNPDTKRVPCHRVICSDGRIGGYAFGTKEKIKKLREEGIVIKNERIANSKQIII